MPESVQNNNVLGKPYVVIALLDWGLGHTTRSIPIIRYLIENNCNVLVACNSKQSKLLAAELPPIPFEELEGYELRYGKSKWFTIFFIIAQVPKILMKINRENKWLHGLSKRKSLGLVISDNRYGFRLNNTPSVFITHQLAIKTGLGNWMDKAIAFFNYLYIERFARCWVPDYANEPSLAGMLSHPERLPKMAVDYIGGLSRMHEQTCADKSIDVLVLLSGPEPQRSILEEKILIEAAHIKKSFVVLRGLPDTDSIPTVSPNVKIFNHLPSQQLQDLLCQAAVVISRSGYSSLMDYMKLGVKSILIPTPGQAEQEYLAQYYQEQGWALFFRQESLELNAALDAAATFKFRQTTWNMEVYKEKIDQYITALGLK